MGGGQLGRMLAVAARTMGFKVAVLEPDTLNPTTPFANYYIPTQYTDKTGLDQLIKHCNIITTEFENVPISSLEYLAQHISVAPTADAVAITQNRLKEKDFFNQIGAKTTVYYPIQDINDINHIPLDIFPAIMKTNTLGYDGKGQIHITNHSEANNAFNQLQHVPCIIEKKVTLAKELSIMIARNHNEIVMYPISENIHHNGILDLSIVPARIDSHITQQINHISSTIVHKLNYHGILGIEFFLTTNNQLLANEMAPRPHNSGHYTLDVNMTSQFEQQIRAICNLKLGGVTLYNNVIMLNLLGDIWLNCNIEFKWQQLLTLYPTLKLHLYEKSQALPGRKMGHLTIQGESISTLLSQIQEIKHILGIKY